MGCGGCRLPAMIRLGRATCDDDAGAERLSVSQKIFKLSGLVAASGQPGLIVALDPNLSAAEMPGKSGQRFERGGEMGEGEARRKFQLHSTTRIRGLAPASTETQAGLARIRKLYGVL